jgi:hypothetical protein
MTVWQNERPQRFLKERIILDFSGVLLAAGTKNYNETEIDRRESMTEER